MKIQTYSQLPIILFVFYIFFANARLKIETVLQYLPLISKMQSSVSGG